MVKDKVQARPLEADNRHAGWGVFALDRIRQGEVIVDLPVNTQQYPDRYSIEAQPGVHVNCMGSIAGMLNHSCKPNAAVRNWRIVAWACVEPGEQVTIDYRKTETKLAEPFVCVCGHCDGARIE